MFNLTKSGARSRRRAEGGTGVIGILTFHWADDCGGMLQAYALKRRLELLGQEAEFLPYAPVKLTGRYWLCPLWAVRTGDGLRYAFQLRALIWNLLLGPCFFTRRRRMRAFRRRYLTAASPVRRAEDLSLLPYQTVLVGSDQVWSPDITGDLDDAYVGNIPRRGGCRLVSYGASLGGNPLPPEYEEKFIRYVSGFDAVSLREETSADYVGRLLGRETRTVLDPVLLLERSEWERAARDPGGGDAIVLYVTEPNEALVRCAYGLSQRLGKPIISLSYASLLSRDFRRRKCAPGIDVRTGCGPAEFLGYLRNACCVLTNSFHGTAFSVLLEKPFLAFPHSAKNARLRDLLEKLGLSSHLLETSRPEEALALWAATDWAPVRARLAAEREASIRFLAENI